MKKPTWRKKQRQQWRHVTDENEKEPSKQWVLRTFSSTNQTADNNHPKHAAIYHQDASSHDPSVTAHPNSRDIPLLEELQRNQSIECQMSSASEDFSSVANDQKSSVKSPSISSAESFLQMNQSNIYQEKMEDGNHILRFPAQVSVCRGEPAIYFDESVLTSNAEKFKYCLVGKFPYSWPSLAHIREWVSRKWKLKGNCSVTLLDLHHVFIRLDNISDMLRIWVRNRWWIDGHLMKIFKWTPEFQWAQGEPSLAAVWIVLPLLPVVFFEEDALFSIASLVGNALAIDTPTRILSRTNVARICVEVNLLKKLPRRVWIGIGGRGGRGFWQHVRYETLPSFCLNCNQQGHSAVVCKFNKDDAITGNSHDKRSILDNSNAEINSPNKRKNSEMLEANKGHKAASQTAVKEEPCCNHLNTKIQHSNAKHLQKTQIEIHNPEECISKVNSPVVKPCSKNLRGQQSFGKVILANSVDLKFSSNLAKHCHFQEKCGISKAIVPNYVEGESSQAKRVEVDPAIQHKDGNNQAIILASSQLPSNRVSFVKAISRSIENSEKLNSGMNKGKQGSGATFSCSSIMNEMFIQRMEETVPFTRISGMQTMDGGNKVDLFLKEVKHLPKLGRVTVVLDEDSPQAWKDLSEKEEAAEEDDDLKKKKIENGQVDLQMMDTRNKKIQGKRTPSRMKFPSMKPRNLGGLIFQFFLGKSRETMFSTNVSSVPSDVPNPEASNNRSGDPSTCITLDEALRTMKSTDQGGEVPSILSGGVLLDQSYPIAPADLNSLLFSPNSKLMMSLMELKGKKDWQEGTWELENGGDRLKRVVTFTKGATKLIKAVKATEEQIYLKADGNVFAVLVWGSSPDVPYGSFYKTQVLVCITPGPEFPSCDQSSRLVMSWRMNFLQSTKMKGTIERWAQQDLKDSFAQFGDLFLRILGQLI
ncbi:uncharacterized protein LOC143853027 [Tasmannia lanceolata]|uniref:uncharacterized protein LOC143853027 n=1 Tax=Tasmannia lanceolata TaxID=3420 RepID=UPI0040642A56